MVNKFISRLKSFFGGKKKMPPKNEVIIDNWLERRRNATTTESMEWSSYQGKGTNAIKSTDTQAVTDKHEPQTRTVTQYPPRHTVSPPPHAKHKHYNCGSAKCLSGSIYVLALFAGDKHWEKAEKQKLLDKLYKAENWIRKEAARYGKNVSFEHGTFGYDKTINVSVVPGHGTGNEDCRVAHKVMKAVGYSSMGEFYEWFKKNKQCTNCVVVVFAQGRGRSYAIPYAPEYNMDYFTESCIIYEAYEDGTPELDSGIAHEILHCFGAEDLYETFEKPQIVEQEAKKHYSNDIMHRLDYDINNLKIDEFTAWCVGLSDAWKEEFRIFLKKK